MVAIFQLCPFHVDCRRSSAAPSRFYNHLFKLLHEITFGCGTQGEEEIVCRVELAKEEYLRSPLETLTLGTSQSHRVSWSGTESARVEVYRSSAVGCYFCDSIAGVWSCVAAGQRERQMERTVSTEWADSQDVELRRHGGGGRDAFQHFLSLWRAISQRPSVRECGCYFPF